ncbi:hypothetical protein Pmani_018049 [Petrolisthes manimaculis]|uniref:Uncharacterized protein n=1 Tax=Petrolisthes manimaculis TaxID=1843537 RepID=A0AAE1PNS4_9EUCA|nr:hypothetical protein Pmani_018049 [Petrolisthes manimaculis]
MSYSLTRSDCEHESSLVDPPPRHVLRAPSRSLGTASIKIFEVDNTMDRPSVPPLPPGQSQGGGVPQDIPRPGT